MWLKMAEIQIRLLPGNDQAGFVPDPEAAAEMITPRTRAIVLVTTNNPVGTEIFSRTLVEFLELSRSANATLLVDETYREFRSEAGPPHKLFKNSSWRSHLLHLYCFSEVCRLPRYRVRCVASPDIA